MDQPLLNCTELKAGKVYCWEKGTLLNIWESPFELSKQILPKALKNGDEFLLIGEPVNIELDDLGRKGDRRLHVFGTNKYFMGFLYANSLDGFSEAREETCDGNNTPAP